MLQGLRALEPANVRCAPVGVDPDGARRTPRGVGVSRWPRSERLRAMHACAWRGLGFGCSSVMDEALERT